jgi:protein cornichon
MASTLSLAADVSFWAALFLGTALLLFSMVYALVLYSDLSRDHVNPTELCELLNRVVLWEYGGHLFLACLLLLRGYFFTTATHLPLLAFHVQRVREKQYLLDNTQIFSDMPRERRVCEWKLGFYLLSFFLYLFLFIQYCIS